MPNWCENVVTVIGADHHVQAFVEAAADDESAFSFERLLGASVRDTQADKPALVALDGKLLAATYRFDTAWNRPEDELCDISGAYPDLTFHTYELEGGHEVADFLTLHAGSAIFEYELDCADEPLQLVTTHSGSPLAMLRPWKGGVVHGLDPASGTPTLETLEALMLESTDLRSILVWRWSGPVAGALSENAVRDDTPVHAVAISPTRVAMAKLALADPEKAFACDTDWDIGRETLLRGLTDLGPGVSAGPALNGPRLVLSLTDRVPPGDLEDDLLAPLLGFPLAQLAALAVNLTDPYDLDHARTPAQTAALLGGVFSP